MFFFSRKKSIISSGILNGFTDCHCHLLPGVDDGFQTMDDTLQCLRQYEEWGVKEVWLTPHIMEDIPNTTSALGKVFYELQSQYRGNIALRLCAEYMMDSLFLERLHTGDLLRYGKDGEEVLVETSYAQPPMNLWSILDDIKSMGLTPVLAHPERYIYMGVAEYDHLRDMRVRLQMNLTSLTGVYGETAQKKAEWLQKRGAYSYFGTDCHSLKHFQSAAEKKINVKFLTI